MHLANLETIIDTLQALPSCVINPQFQTRLLDLRTKSHNQELLLVVLGQYKRGKTTLINALLGEKLLPSAIIPLTSIITILQYGETKKVVVEYQSGPSEEIKLTDLELYVTETNNPQNVKAVKQVIISYPSDYLKHGVKIIDTPGVGSVHKHNNDVSYDYVPKADACVFVFAADPPISAAELEFLETVKDYLGKIILIQNKIDQVDLDDKKASLEFTLQTLQSRLGLSDLDCVQISAKQGLEAKLTNNTNLLKQSCVPVLEHKLSQFLTYTKDEALALSLIHKLLYLIQEIELTLQISKQSQQLSLKDLQDKLDAFENHITGITQAKEDSDFLLEGQAEKLVKQVLLDDIETLTKEQLPKLTNKLDTFYQTHRHLTGKELVQAFNDFIACEIKTIFSAWRKEEQAKLQGKLATILDRFSVTTNTFMTQVFETSANLFNLDLQTFNSKTKLPSTYEFRFAFDEYQVNLELFTPVVSRLPKLISHPLLFAKNKERLQREFDRHCGRSRYDFHQRVMRGVLQYKTELNDSLDHTIKTLAAAIRQGLKQKETQTAQQSIYAKQLDKQLQVINCIKTQLSNGSIISS